MDMPYLLKGLIIIIILFFMFVTGLKIFYFKEILPKPDYVNEEFALLAYALFINFVATFYSSFFYDTFSIWDFIYLLFAVICLYLASGKYFVDTDERKIAYEFLYSLSAGFVVGTIAMLLPLINQLKISECSSKLDIVGLLGTTVFFLISSWIIVEYDRNNMLKKQKKDIDSD